MNKYLLFTICGVTFNVNAQDVFYYAPLIELSNLNTPLEKVGHDFGYAQANENVTQGYYLWLDNQWYLINNANHLFNQTDNKLAFYIDWNKKDDLKIKDQHDFVYSYPIEALDRFKTTENQYQQLAMVVIDTAPNTINKEDYTTKISTENNNKETTFSPLLDVIEIKEEVITTVLPFVKESDKQNNQDIKTVISEDISTSNTFNYNEENPYEKAVINGFEGSVTEWIEFETEKNGKTPYETALEKGYDRSETDFMRLLWGSKVNPEIDRKERDTKYVLDWIEKIKNANDNTPYEIALKHGFYGTFTEWVESVIGKDGENIYNEDVKRGYKGSYRSWVENKLKASNEELARKELLRNQNFIMVPNMILSTPLNPDEVATFSLYNYYQMYYGNSVISSNTSAKSIDIKPQEIEYQITWFNQNEIKINAISPEGIIYYQKNPSYSGTTSNINVRYIIK